MTTTIRPGALALAAAATLFAAGCDNTQVLYTYEDEPGPRMEQVAGGAMPPAVSALMEEEGTAQPAAPAPQDLDAPPSDRRHLPDDAELTTVGWFGIMTEVPSNWEQTPPDSPMRAAQFTVPPPSPGAQGAELVVFHFGLTAGGSAQENVQRWIGQLEPDIEPVHYRAQRDGLTITEVIVEGTMLPSTMGTGPTQSVPDSALHGVVIEGGPQGSIFLRLSGGRTAVRDAEPAIATLVRQARMMP